MIENVKAFVDLDSLLDTRIGIIAGLWPQHAEVLAKDERYFKRLDDKFDRLIPGFPQKDFEDTYAGRTYGHITKSAMTSIVSRLKMFARATYAQNVSKVNESVTTLVVNLYPYKLPDEHRKQLRETLLYATEFHAVDFVSLDLGLITPSLLSEFELFITYDFDSWLNVHNQALAKCPIPRVETIHPYIQHKDMGLPPAEVVEEVKRTLRVAIDVTPVPLDDFSFIIPA
ncbi:hypothetical protein [Vibrio phage vB_VmeM-Yong XC32]|nr:hypothetical protein [Vibrio phage vB_VmeM-Yong XC31]QAX96459.1 hypothetical protein [Vibrio phage vB_VmeM-Yong XC32]QAX96776.1 hypothetical protein [Vibrio phage vB_VmeM-Yong MS31]QAX97095.1 hypothetical protein [Vibrio phage vB_VmeM-Yong MS32]